MTTWITLETARANWADADGLSDPILTSLLEAAQDQITEYAPTSLITQLDELDLPDDEADLPSRLREALLLQVRELWRAGEREGDTIGLGDYTIVTKPLIGSVKKLLRPTRAVPRVR